MQPFGLDVVIWRYLAFDKFIDFTTTSELHLSLPSRFDDTWEMYPPKGFLNVDHWKARLANNGFPDPVNVDELASNTAGYFEAAYEKRDEYAFSCWSQTDRDHAGLWELYTDRERKSGVAVSTTPRRLLNAIRASIATKQRIIVGRVEYLDYEADDFPVLSHVTYHLNSNEQIIENRTTFVMPFFTSAHHTPSNKRFALPFTMTPLLATKL